MTRKIFKYLFSLFAIFYISLDLYIYFCYNDRTTAEILTWECRIAAWTDDDSIPNNITNAYEKVFPNSLTNKIYPDLLWFICYYGHKSSYPQIALAQEISHTDRFKLISMANQIDNRLTHKQSIYAYLSKFYFSNNGRGIIKAAKLYYNKNIKDLTERECLELVIMTTNAAFFNKFRYQDRLDNAAQKIIDANNK